MAVKTIETRAKITAEDRTGATFAQVAQKLRGLEQNAASASRRMDSVARRMSDVGRARMRHEDIARRMSSGFVAPPAGAGPGFGQRAGQITSAGFKSVMATAAAAGAGAALAAPVLKRIVDASARRVNEQISHSVAGLSAGEIGDIQNAASGITGRHRSITRTESEGTIRELRTVLGNVEGAIAISDEMARLRVILKRNNPNADAAQISKEMSDIARAADLAGATRSKPEFARFISDYAQMRNALGDTVLPSMFLEAAMHSRGAISGFDPRFIGSVLPSLIQTQGGSGAGTALAGFRKAIVGGKMEHSALVELQRLGLVDKNRIIKAKNGDLKGVAAGGIVGSSLAQRDPFAWTQQHLVPAFERHGIKGREATDAAITRLFSKSTVGELAGLLVNNASQIERDRTAIGKAKGLSAADEIEARDLNTATAAVRSQFENLGAVLGGNVTPRLTDFSNALAKRVGEFAESIKDDPRAQTRTLIGGGLAALGLGGLGVSGVSGLFSGAGVFGGMGAGIASLPAMTPAIVTATGAAAGYKGYEAFRSVKGVDQLPPQNWLEEKAAAFDRWTGLAPKHEPWQTVAERMRGLSGPQGPIEAKAKLEGSAQVSNKLEIGLAPGFAVVRSDGGVQADGALRSNVGISMPSER